jgi:hypothetical protein
MQELPGSGCMPALCADYGGIAGTWDMGRVHAAATPRIEPPLA